MTPITEWDTWRKSSRSGPDGGECVEVTHVPGGRRGVRDSKNPTGPALLVSEPEWVAFINSMKNGRFS
ncbi:DUF397 domain-containing protein [Sphaerisporangium melleum]|uniref:DUF397 domain-containing protein n=1 Tax=Sphaerisporangium melleum TaxID=321316 RepID=UPI00166E5563|nr:DUF397 domain-containing protein [Sphaerisporangium melleum]